MPGFRVLFVFLSFTSISVEYRTNTFLHMLVLISHVEEASKEKFAPFASLSGDESYANRDLEKTSQQVAKKLYDVKVQPATLIPKQVRNMYTASLYASFTSLIHNKDTELDGKRVVMFSYGSGLTSTMFSFKLREGQHPFSLSNIATVMDISGKLKGRHEVSPEKFIETLQIGEHRYGGKEFVTSKDRSLLTPGTYYLTHVDSLYRRFYAKKGQEGNAADSLFEKKNPTRTVLERLLAKLDEADSAHCFTSGMAALAAVTHLVGPGQEIVAGADIYGGSDRLLSQIIPGKGIGVKRVDMTDIDEVASAIGPLTKLAWLESPTNPLQQISDIRKISELAHAHGALLLVDNDIMSLILSQPLELGTLWCT